MPGTKKSTYKRGSVGSKSTPKPKDRDSHLHESATNQQMVEEEERKEGEPLGENPHQGEHSHDR